MDATGTWSFDRPYLRRLLARRGNAPPDLRDRDSLLGVLLGPRTRLGLPHATVTVSLDAEGGFGARAWDAPRPRWSPEGEPRHETFARGDWTLEAGHVHLVAHEVYGLEPVPSPRTRCAFRLDEDHLWFDLGEADGVPWGLRFARVTDPGAPDGA